MSDVPDRYKELLLKAIEAGEKRDYEKSTAILLQLVAETDSIPEAFLYLGRSYHASGEYYNAVQAFKYYISYRSNSAKGYFFLGRTYLVLGFFVKALKCFKNALDLSPKNPEILSLTGMTYLKLKKVSIALIYLEQAVFAASGNKSIYNAYLNVLHLKGIKDLYSGSIDEAGQIFEFLIQSGMDIPSVQLHLAYVKKEKGDFNESLELYQKVIQANQGDHLLKMQIIPLLLQTGRNDEAAQIISELTRRNIPVSNDSLKYIDINRIMAVESYGKNKYKDTVFYAKKVLKENYYDNEMHLLIGEAFRHTNNLDKAENHFRLVAKRDLSKVEAVYGIIMVLWVQERFNELLEELRKGKKKFPEDKIIDYYYALTASKLLHSPDETISLLNKEIERNAPDSYLFEALGDQYFRLSKNEQAESCFLKAIKINKKQSSAYISLIKTYHRLGQKSKVGTVFRDYLNLYPDDDKTRRYYINHLYNTGNFKKTAKEIERYSSRFEVDSTLNKLLSRCYINTGEYQKAMILYRQLLRANPDNGNYLLSYAYCLDKLCKTKEALDLLERSRSFIKNNITIELSIGVLSYRQKYHEKALNAFKKVLEINENEWRAYYNISKIYEEQGLKDLASKFRARSEQLEKNT